MKRDLLVLLKLFFRSVLLRTLHRLSCYPFQTWTIGRQLSGGTWLVYSSISVYWNTLLQTLLLQFMNSISTNYPSLLWDEKRCSVYYPSRMSLSVTRNQSICCIDPSRLDEWTVLISKLTCDDEEVALSAIRSIRKRLMSWLSQLNLKWRVLRNETVEGVHVGYSSGCIQDVLYSSSREHSNRQRHTRNIEFSAYSLYSQRTHYESSLLELRCRLYWRCHSSFDSLCLLRECLRPSSTLSSHL